MSEVDDRLAGDPVWELFPQQAPRRGSVAFGAGGYGQWLAVACLVAGTWMLSPPLAVMIGCLAFAIDDVRKGRRFARSIPDKAGGAICARFTYAWGAWKIGCTGFAAMLVLVAVFAASGRRGEMPEGCGVAMLLWSAGFSASAILTASGLLAAYRSGMRVWIGEGINRARTLLLGMLIVAFTFVAIGPWCLWLLGPLNPLNPAGAERTGGVAFLAALLGPMIVGALAILLILDWLSRRVVADAPGKFGPKVPAVGKWST
jgi:hypothetical protein